MLSNEDTEIGGIVNSNSHIDYVCEVYRPRVRENPPDPVDYQFGQFVYIQKTIRETEHAGVGVIYNTQLVDPDQGRTGPRLAQPDEQEVFMPEYVDEKQTLAGVALLGYGEVVDDQLVNVHHSVPPWVLEIDDVVKTLSPEGIVDFHERNGSIHIEYYQRILDVAGAFGADVLKQVLSQLQDQRPEETDALEVIRRNLDWETKMGGEAR